MPQKLTAQQSVDVAGDCVRQVTHSHRPLNLAEQLVLYGVFTPQQSAAVRNNVVANGMIGVHRFNFSLDPQFLITLSGGWTMGQLATVIRQSSVPNQPGLVLAAPAPTGPEHFALAAMHLAEAASSFAGSAGKRGGSKKSGKKNAKKSSKKGASGKASKK
jgi:hypothetical protein